ncbi:hypothetical protein GW17_00045457 [Ensete ventricosum]|nr:hypothetical protein GW17_00045457 [Ensete ventricosum]
MARLQLHLGSSSPSQQHIPEEDAAVGDDEDEEEEECPISPPLIVTGSEGEEGEEREDHGQHQPFSIMAVVVAALRKSLVMCSVGAGEGGACRPASPASMEIGWPTDVRHVAHVTFDRFDGFLGLPIELEPEVPLRVPSARSNPVSFSLYFFVLGYFTFLIGNDAMVGVLSTFKLVESSSL